MATLAEQFRQEGMQINKGMTAAEIASITNMSVSEVKVLRKNSLSN